MGIKSLHSILKAWAPDAYRTVHLSQFAFQKIAVDVSLYIHSYTSVFGNCRTALATLIACLRRNDIHPVFVFDGIPPKEKARTKEDRVQDKLKQVKRTKRLQKQLKLYEEEGEIGDELMATVERLRKRVPNKRLLLVDEEYADNQRISGAELAKIAENIEKRLLRETPITDKDFKFVEELCEAMGVLVIKATGEAEELCAKMCICGTVAAVLSEDTDILAQGSPVFLFGIDTGNDTCRMLQRADVLEDLQLDDQKFLDLCILCGTDYNDNIRGIGPTTAYGIVWEYGSIEGALESGYLKPEDVEILNYERSRELFLMDSSMGNIDVPFCSIPNINELKIFLFKHNVNLRESMLSAFDPARIECE